MDYVTSLAPCFLALMTFLGFWMRIEHRLTRLETLQEKEDEEPKRKRR